MLILQRLLYSRAVLGGTPTLAESPRCPGTSISFLRSDQLVSDGLTVVREETELAEQLWTAYGLLVLYYPTSHPCIELNSSQIYFISASDGPRGADSLNRRAEA